MAWKALLWDAGSHAALFAAGLLLSLVIQWCRRQALRRQLNAVYLKVRMVVEFDTLSNPNEANRAFMLSDARDAVNMLAPRLQRAGLFPPETATRENLPMWFEYLGKIRVRVGA